MWKHTHTQRHVRRRMREKRNSQKKHQPKHTQHNSGSENQYNAQLAHTGARPTQCHYQTFESLLCKTTHWRRCFISDRQRPVSLLLLSFRCFSSVRQFQINHRYVSISLRGTNFNNQWWKHIFCGPRIFFWSGELKWPNCGLHALFLLFPFCRIFFVVVAIIDRKCYLISSKSYFIITMRYNSFTNHDENVKFIHLIAIRIRTFCYRYQNMIIRQLNLSDSLPALECTQVDYVNIDSFDSPFYTVSVTFIVFEVFFFAHFEIPYNSLFFCA